MQGVNKAFYGVKKDGYAGQETPGGETGTTGGTTALLEDGIWATSDGVRSRAAPGTEIGTPRDSSATECPRSV